MKVRRDQANIPSPVTLAYVRNRLEDAAGPVSTYLSNSGPKRWEVGRTHSRYNYIVNPSFENNVLWWSAQQGSMERVTGFSHSGNACAKYTKDDSGSTGIVWTSSGSALVLQAFTGKTYTFSIWLYHENATDKSFSVVMYERYRIGGNVGTPETVNYTVPPHVWTRVHVTKTMIEDAETSYSLVYPHGFAEGESFYLDDAQFEEGSEPTDYFDGSHENAVWATFPSGVEGTPHSSASIINPSPVHEDVTTNYLINPSAEVNASFVNAVGGGVVVTRDTTHGLFGGASFKVVCDGTSTPIQGMYQYTEAGTSATGTTWSASAWIKAPLGFAMRMLIREDTGGSYGYQFFTGTGTWQWVTMTYTTVDPGNSYVHLRIDNSNGSSVSTPYTMYVDGMQMEKSAFASSYTDGSLGSGYAWTGTAHASTSTRAARALSVPLEDHIDYDEGAVMYWYKPKEKSTTTQILFNAGVSSQRQLYATYWASSNTIRLTSTNASASSNAISGVVDPNTYHFVYADWDSTTIRQSVDGGAFVSNVRTGDNGATVNYNLNLWLGTSGGGTSSSNGDLSEIIFLDRRLELEEIQRIYESSSASLLQPDMFDYAPPVLSRDRYQPQVSRIPRPKKQVSRQVQPVSMIQRTKSTLESPTVLADLADGDTMFYTKTGIQSFSTSGPVRYKPSPFSRINYVVNPCGVSPLGISWGKNGGAETLTSETGDATFPNCLKVVTTGSKDQGAFTSISGRGTNPIGGPSVSVGDTYTFSCWVRTDGINRSLSIYIVEFQNSGYIFSPTFANFTGTGEWQRVSFTHTVTSPACNNLLGFVTVNDAISGQVFYITQALFEKAASAGEYFDGRSANALWLDLRTGYTGTAHASPSVTNAAHWMDSNVTNVITNPSFETNTVGWQGASATISRVTTQAWSGNAAVQVVTSNATSGEGLLWASTTSLPAAVGQTWTLSGYVKGSGTLVPRISERNSSGADLGTFHGSVITLTSNWQRVVFTRTIAQTGCAYIRPSFTTDPNTPAQNVTFFVDGIQLEQRAYASSYADGSLGFGHAWTGTTHGSASTRAFSIISASPPNTLSPRSGSAAGWVRVDTLVEHRLFFFVSLTNYYQCFLQKETGRFYFSVRNTAAASQGVTSSTPIIEGSWYFVYVSWDEQELTISVNNSALDTVALAIPLDQTFSGDPLRIGSYPGNDRNADFADVFFFNRPLTAAERTALYTGKAGAFPFKQPTKILRTQGD